MSVKPYWNIDPVWVEHKGKRQKKMATSPQGINII